MGEGGFEEWAVVELFGRQKVAGRVSEQTIGGCSFIRVNIPEGDSRAAQTKFYGQGAIYCMTPVAESVARAAAQVFAPAPVARWELPALPPAPPATPPTDDEDPPDDDDDDDDEDLL